MDHASDTTPATRRERDLARHRREILDAAVALFAAHGYHQTTMQMIADRAEFSVGYLYKHFPGKEELYEALVRFHTDALDARLAEIRDDGLAPLEQMRRNLEEAGRHFNGHRDFMRIFHQGAAGDTPALHAVKARHQAEIQELIEKAQAAGELREVDPVLLAAAIQGAVKELLGQLAARNIDHPFDALPDLVFSLLIDHLRK